MVGGGSALLRLASKVDAIKETLDNYEQQVSKLAISRGRVLWVKLLLHCIDGIRRVLLLKE